LALIGTGIVVMGLGVVIWMRLPAAARVEIGRRAKVGLMAGFLATVAYDIARWLILTILHDTVAAFHVFPLFGYAIGGTGLNPVGAVIIGTVYHYANGVLFAVAYAILLSPRGWWAGILWGLGLEALMLSMYPGWVHPT